MKKRRQFSRGTTPPSTGKLLTHVRDPRAVVRFSLDDRVWWNEGNRRLVGTIVGFAEDECLARVRLDMDGSVVFWPTMSARMKRLQNSTFVEELTIPDDESRLDTIQIEPISPDPKKGRRR